MADRANYAGCMADFESRCSVGKKSSRGGVLR